MEIDEIKKMAVHLMAIADHLETRIDQSTQNTLQASQHLDQVARNLNDSSTKIVRQSIDDFTRAVDKIMTDGNQPFQSSLHQLKQVGMKLDRQMQISYKMHIANAWKTFIVSAIASLLVIVFAVYIGYQSEQKRVQADWIESISHAIEQGKLTRCSDNKGLCANDGQQVIRLE